MEPHRAIVDFIAARRRFAVAVVLRAEGSTPQVTGARALIDETGAIHGTIGGGAVEAAAQRRAVQALGSGVPCVFDCALVGSGKDADPICGGGMRVLLDPNPALALEAYSRAASACQRRERGALLTAVQNGPAPRVTVSWLGEAAIPNDLPFPGAAQVRECLARETTRLFPSDLESGGPGTEVLVEPVLPPPRLLVVGGGHVGRAVAQQAGPLGFDITVLDDRPDFTQPALFPAGVTTRCGDVASELAKFPFDGDTYVVLVTRGHIHDAAALAACIRKPAAYLGMIGSQRKVALVRREFLESGRATPAEWARVCAPIGLDIGAVTVPEIAVSIVAQLIAVRRHRAAAAASTGSAP